MKILLINGSPKGKRSNSLKLAYSFIEGFKNGCTNDEESLSIDELHVASMNIAACKGCFACWQKTPGICCIKDDFIETALMSLIYEGRFYAFPPVTELPEAGVTVIRPMMYVPEQGVAHFVADQGIRVVKNTCPVDGSTKRAYAKQLIEQINRETPGAKERIMHAIMNGRFPDWPM